MDTVSMLNTMSFYCQPILPLVYDESMSYYETLCKVVGQLNNTGETVNKLNEGLTAEIADRQAGDAALDARIKQIEETTRKIHFLKVDTLGHLLTADVTREKLSQWVQNGDLIAMLYAPDELENSWAVATNYRSMGATGADTMQLNFYVPVSITHNAGKSGLDTAQEVVVISLPVGELTNQWVVRTITNTIPRTNADGFVNLTATVSDAGAVTCDVEPGAIIDALRNAYSGTNQYAVAVNARLTYDGKQYHAADAIVKSDVSGTGNVRIAFENYWDGVRAENGVRQTTNTTVFLVGDAKNNAWSVETIDYKTFDFSRYEGFQFTRGAHNVITTNDESTPNAVYAQYHSATSGKLYQNLPTRLIDSVDGAEYWNGTFDIYGGNHMTFTFVTSNYATASDKMLVRVIELSADVGTTAWKYGVKEFTLPLEASNGVVTYTASKVGEGEYLASEHKAEYRVDFAEGIPAIITSIESGKRVIFRVDLKEIDSVTGATPVYFASGYTKVSLSSDIQAYLFAGDILNGNYSLKITSGLEHATLTYYGDTLPVPNPDSTDNGKVPTVNGTAWELKTPTGGGSPDAVLYTPQTLTDEQKKQARENVEAAATTFVVNAAPHPDGSVTLDKTAEQIRDAINIGKTPVVLISGVYLPMILADGTNFLFGVTAPVSGEAKLQAISVSESGSNILGLKLVSTSANDALPQQTMASAPSSDMQIATKKYVDDTVADAVESSKAVLYTEQALTVAQQFQARKNIGALGHNSPQVQGFLTLSPANETLGIGVGLSPSRDGNNFALDISDVNEDTPTKLTGVKTPTDADTNAAATVEYVIGKAKKKVWIDVDVEEVKTFNYTDIDNEITNGGSNVWLRLGTVQLRMVACNKSGASSYELTFVNMDGAGFNIHTVTVSASAAEYSVTTK